MPGPITDEQVAIMNAAAADLPTPLSFIFAECVLRCSSVSLGATQLFQHADGSLVFITACSLAALIIALTVLPCCCRYVDEAPDGKSNEDTAFAW